MYLKEEVGNSMTGQQSVVHVISSMTEAYAGPTVSVSALSRAQTQSGWTSNIYSVNWHPEGRTVESNSPFSFNQSLNSTPILEALRFSSELKDAVYDWAKAGELVHQHGLWLMPNIYPGMAARKFGNPLIVAPRGMLSPGALRFSSTKKRFIWHIAQKRALLGAKCFHATSLDEAADVRRAGFSQPIFIIPNGIEIPEPTEHDPHANYRELLYLGRIHPKKGLSRLLKAWKKVEDQFPAWHLKIVGQSEGGHLSQLKSQSQSLELKRVSFLDPVYGERKTSVYQRADLFILPTFSENFGNVVAEALAAGTPVICSTGAPWEGIKSHNCGWWTECDEQTLATNLSVAMSKPREELSEMGNNGRIWMRREFDWSQVAESVIKVYSWCVGNSALPEELIYKG